VISQTPDHSCPWTWEEADMDLDPEVLTSGTRGSLWKGVGGVVREVEEGHLAHSYEDILRLRKKKNQKQQKNRKKKTERLDVRDQGQPLERSGHVQ